MSDSSSNQECGSVVRVVVPGWGIPSSFYSALDPDIVFDHGFFPSDNWSTCGGSGEAPIMFRPETPGTADGFPAMEKPFEIVAHSFGSFAALAKSEFRDRAERIIILGGFAKFAKSADNPAGTPVERIDAMFAELRTTPERLLKRFLFLMARPEKFRFPRLPKVLNVETLTAGLEILKNRDIRGHLQSMKPRMKFAHGELDAVASVKLGRTAAELAPNAEFLAIPEAGHAIPFTRNQIC
ncbi:MAG: hypothetical protein KAG97_06600 [Victivallales bacterium]|nr:hypothetical protein [Victivallales bacterium]